MVNNPGDSDLESGLIIDRDEFLEINKNLKADGNALATYKKTKPATFSPILMGITNFIEYREFYFCSIFSRDNPCTY